MHVYEFSRDFWTINTIVFGIFIQFLLLSNINLVPQTPEYFMTDFQAALYMACDFDSVSLMIRSVVLLPVQDLVQ
jgi:hypothetical protein